MRRERLILLVAGEKYSIVWLSVEAIYSESPFFFLSLLDTLAPT